jgi:hypothetical protein
MIAAGKCPNCFDLVDSRLIWDPDVNPEGIAFKYGWEMTERVKPWIIGAYLTFLETDPSVNILAADGVDVDGLAAQAGTTIDFTDTVNLKTALTYYNFRNVPHAGLGAAGVPLLDDYDLLSLAGELGFKVGEVPCSVFAEWVQNMEAQGGGGRNTAWKVGLRVNKVKQKRDLAFQLDWSDVEQDGVAYVVGDSDHGYSNYRGPTASLSYGLFNNTVLTATVYCMDSVANDADTFANDFLKGQIDVTVKF